MSSRHFVLPNSSNRQKRFSIDDAFEEETDEAIKVYGSTCMVMNKDLNSSGDCTDVKVDTR